MSISFIILSLGIGSAIFTSIIASIIHKMNWYKSVKKTNYRGINLFMSNFYQFNDRFYSAFSFLRELMINSLLISLIFKYLICTPSNMDLLCISGSLALTCIIRIISQLVVYSKFYDEDLVK